MKFHNCHRVLVSVKPGRTINNLFNLAIFSASRLTGSTSIAFCSTALFMKTLIQATIAVLHNHQKSITKLIGKTAVLKFACAELHCIRCCWFSTVILRCPSKIGSTVRMVPPDERTMRRLPVPRGSRRLTWSRIIPWNWGAADPSRIASTNLVCPWRANVSCVCWCVRDYSAG